MSERMAYVALVSECGCLVAAAVDEPAYRKDNAKLIAQKVRQGFRIERMPVEEVRKLPFGYPCEHMKATEEAAKRPQGAALFS